jgi:hypothetical protein
MKMRTTKNLVLIPLAIACLFAAGIAVQAQTTSFTYQGRLSDNTIAANGTYEMQFSLFDASANGNQIGSTVSNANVSVVNGIFTVNLDFGAGAFTGANRFLLIAVRAAGNPNPHTVLSPRQLVTSTPYSIKSLFAGNADTATNSENSDELGGIAANQYVLTTDSRLSNSRDPNSGSSFYVQNRTTQQANTNFNISGNGTVGGTIAGNVVNSTTNYNINGNRVLSTAGTDNLFAGFSAGTNNTGFSNTFAGGNAGQLSTSGNFNSFFGNFAGGSNSTGSSNTFLGRNAGASNTTGSNNTIIGSLANVVGANRSFATAIGAGATVADNNSIVLGRSSDTVSVPGVLSVKGSISITAGVFGLPLANQGSTPICGVSFPGSSSFVLSHCSSSITYKTDVQTFTAGFSLLNSLRPVTYKWRGNGTRDIGFIAEEVAGVEPLLVTYNEKGQIEGVKYGQITTVLVNAVKEQQKQIEMLKTIVCQDHPQAQACKGGR